MNFSQIGENFVDTYFRLWNVQLNEAGEIIEEQRAQLQGLYGPQSFLTMQGHELVGTEMIMNYICQESLRGVRKLKEVVNSQPIPVADGCILVVVQGAMQMSPTEVNTLPFTEVFIILATPDGNVQVVSQILTTHGVKMTSSSFFSFSFSSLCRVEESKFAGLLRLSQEVENAELLSSLLRTRTTESLNLELAILLLRTGIDLGNAFSDRFGNLRDFYVIKKEIHSDLHLETAQTLLSCPSLKIEDKDPLYDFVCLSQTRQNHWAGKDSCSFVAISSLEIFGTLFEKETPKLPLP